MKQLTQHIVILILAATVFFTGAGVTVVDYYCKGCQPKTFLLADHESCCMKIEHEHGGCDNDEYNSNVNHLCFKAERLSVDLNASSSVPEITSPIIWLTHSPMDSCPACVLLAGYAAQCTSSESPPITSARAYLSQISVLII